MPRRKADIPPGLLTEIKQLAGSIGDEALEIEGAIADYGSAGDTVAWTKEEAAALRVAALVDLRLAIGELLSEAEKLRPYYEKLAA